MDRSEQLFEAAKRVLPGGVNSPVRAFRAVGMANNRNPIAIIVPCHRIIGSTGALVGYGGGLGMKERLLELERRYGPAD